jgi:hypothetical protein
MPTLLAISTELDRLNALISEADGEITPEMEAAVAELFQGQERLEEKADSYAAVIRGLKLRSAAKKEESEILAKEATRVLRQHHTIEKQIDWLEGNLLSVFRAQNIKRLQTRRYTLTRATNGGKVWAKLTDDVSILPEIYKKSVTVVAPDRDKITEDLVAGKAIPGCSLPPRGEHLRIT